MEKGKETIETPVVFCNQYGQVECHGCGAYSDIIYPVHLRNANGSWVSMCCRRCSGERPGMSIVKIDPPINTKTYKGPIRDVRI